MRPVLSVPVVSEAMPKGLMLELPMPTPLLKKVTIPVTHAEAVILESALRAAITRLIGR